MENKPKGALSQISKVVDSAIDWIIVIMFASLIVSCVTQVFMRSILNDSPPWTEELARYSFMYVNFIGAVICVREKSHARVTVILDALSSTARKVLEVIADLVTLFVSYVMIHYGTIKTDEPRTLDFSGVRGFLVTNVCIVQRPKMFTGLNPMESVPRWPSVRPKSCDYRPGFPCPWTHDP